MSARVIWFREYDFNDYAGLTLIDTPEAALSRAQYMQTNMTVYSWVRLLFFKKSEGTIISQLGLSGV